MSSRSHRRWWLIWVITAVAVPASFWAAPYPQELVLQHVPTTIGLVILSVVIRKRWLDPISLGCSFSFLWLHLIGARWIYSFVPYDDVSQWLTGHRLSDVMDWRRNHYDRLVHFASGVLGVPIASDGLRRTCGMRPPGAAVMGIATVLAVGALYEILEWAIAVTLSPAHAEAYNGQQGDPWDPQKDLALAAIGAVGVALASALSAVIMHRRTRLSSPTGGPSIPSPSPSSKADP